VLLDLVLDPLALSQVHRTAEGTIGRWSWYIGTGDVNLFGAPIYNYTGWMLLCGYATAWILVGRWWFRRSGERTRVAIAYPIVCLLAGLLTMVSPLSQFLLWLGPMVAKGGWTEYLMLGVALAALLAVLVTWRGRMRRSLTWAQDWAIAVVWAGLQVCDLVFLVIGAQWRILLFSLPVIAAQWAIVFGAFARRAPVSSDRPLVEAATAA
jgi:hypothetical protein